MNRLYPKVLVAASILALASAGCGGGNRYASVSDGKVESGVLDLRDIPVRPEPKEYVVGQGDVLDILFLYNDDFNQLGLKVRPDGKISLPYVGDVPAAGKPASELDSILTARYSEIIVNPDITVVVKEYRPQVVYAMGEVDHAGGYDYRPGMTLMDFLALSGGPNLRGKRNEIVVIRRVAPERIVGIQIDFKELIDRRRLDLNIPLEAFDIVYVPKSRLASGQDFMNAVKDILMTPAELYLKGWQIANVEALYEFYTRSGNVF